MVAKNIELVLGKNIISSEAFIGAFEFINTSLKADVVVSPTKN